jgi:L-2-hydroxycarboxylate dehydrogenase (NAD+)
MSETFHIVPFDQHSELVSQAYQHRGYTEAEAAQAARFSNLAAEHGIRTHNAIKALHLDLFF